jgi:TonB family protein
MFVALSRFMMLLRVPVCTTILLVLCGSASPLDDVQKTAEGMLNGARQLSDIRSPNAPGFRLNVTFSFVGPDLDPLHGTYTEVWISNAQWRRETVVGDYRNIEIGGPDKYWLIDGGKDLPEEAARVSTIVDMFPKRSAIFEFETITDYNPTTQCAVTKAKGEKHRKQAFCFDKDKRVLKESVAPRVFAANVTDYSCRYNQFWKFGDYWFPHEMVCFMDGRQRLEAKVVGLSFEPSPEATLFTLPAGAVEIGDCSVAPVPPKALSTPAPRSMLLPSQLADYQYSVVVRMVIDTKGKPRNLRITRSGGKESDDIALRTVRAWDFKPGTCKGEPMAVPNSVEMKFWGED